MIDEKEVLKALVCRANDLVVDCTGCPYRDRECEFICDFQRICRDTLDLLNTQEPRIVTTADFENNPNLDDSGHLNVWEEYKDSTRSGWNTINVNDVIAFTDIRRYWTARPTEGQRKAVKWNG